MKRRDILAGLGSLATGAASSFPAPAIAQGLRTQDGDRLARRVAGTSVQCGSFGADDRSRNRRAHQYRGISIRRIGAPVRNLRRGGGWRRRHVSLDRVLLGKKVAGVPFFRGRPLRVHRGRTVRVGSLRRWSRAVGFAQRAIQHQAAPVSQHRYPDGRLVYPRDHLAGRIQRAALPDARTWRRGAAAAWVPIVVTLPGSEIVPALKSGAIDASEWVGPWLDMAMGLHKAAGYYYYPGFHEPGTGSAVGINKTRVGKHRRRATRRSSRL